MKYIRFLFLIFLFSSMSVFSQEKFKQHTVSKGETISEIAKKYNVKPSAIYELNPDAVNGIQLKSVLLIPGKSKTKEVTSTAEIVSNTIGQTHEVLPKETLYGITKQYKISLNDLYKVNPDLEKEGLKIGQTITIPQTTLRGVAETKVPENAILVKNTKDFNKKTSKEETVIEVKEIAKNAVSSESFVHEVLPKESLYSISHLYNITLTQLQKANPELEKKSLKAGQKITIPGNIERNSSLLADKKETQKDKDIPGLTPSVGTKKEQEIAKTTPVAIQSKVENNQESLTTTTHKVLPKESLYSIANFYNISLSDLLKANPQIEKKSLKAGQKISIPFQPESNSTAVAAKTETKTEDEISTLPHSIDSKKGKGTDKTVAVSPESKIDNNAGITEYTHQVLPKETKYGIAKEYGLSVTELEKQNPSIAKKLLVGAVLTISSSKIIEKEAAVSTAVAVDFRNSVENGENRSANSPYDANLVDQLISKASENIGTPYRSGGTSRDGFDCSGLMCYTFSNSDIKLPRSSMEMASYGSKVDAQNAQKGDLIFFKTSGRGRITHVGMVVEVVDGEIKFIHSSNHGGVIISSTKESYYGKRLVQVNRVL